MALRDYLRVFFLGPTPAPASTPEPAPVAKATPAVALAHDLMRRAAARNDAAGSGGFELAKASTKTPLSDSPGVPGFAAYGGRVDDRERSPDLRGTAKWTTYRDNQLNSPNIAAGQRRFMNLCGAPRWIVPAPDGSTPEEVERAAFAQRQLENLATPWDEVVMTGCLAQFDGAAIQVTSFRKVKTGPDAGLVGLRDIVSRPMHTIDRWLLDEQRNVVGVVQRDPETGTEYPVERGRMVWSRDIPLTDNPNGVGINRQLAEPARRTKALQKQLDVGFETDLGGIPVVYAPVSELKALINTQPPGMNRPYTQADFNAAIEGVLSFTESHIRTKETGLLLDSGTHKDASGNPSGAPLYRAEVLQSGGKAHGELARRIDRLEWQELAIIGAEYIALGQDGGGSLAMAKVKSADFYRLVSGALNRYATAIRRDVLRVLWALNGWDPETAPKPDWDRGEFTDPLEVATSLLPALASAGVPLDRRDLATVNPIVTRLGLAPLEEHADDLEIDPRREAMADDLGLNGEDDDGTPNVDVDEEDGDDAEDEKPPAEPAKKSRHRRRRN